MSKRAVIISAVFLVLLLGGGYLGSKWHSGTQPAFRGRAIPVKGVEDKYVDDWVAAFEKALSDEEVLKKILAESNYASLLEVPDGEALSRLKESIRVRKKNSNKTIEIGINGQRKDDEILKDIGMTVYKIAEEEVRFSTPSFQDYIDPALKAGQ